MQCFFLSIFPARFDAKHSLIHHIKYFGFSCPFYFNLSAMFRPVFLLNVFVAVIAEFSCPVGKVCETESSLHYRFGSFAPVRNGTQATWFVDGKDYMSAVADAIEFAKKEILITGWQMNPYIFMRRPDKGVDSLKWRLDKMLSRKADEGVRVYILLYYEKQIAMDLGSHHTQSLLNKHRNIEVHRHPDMLSIAKNFTTIWWSHHEKMVIVDGSIAFVGGIDLCYGRWDDHSHELMDNYPVHPCTEHDEECAQESIKQSNVRYSRWVGKDYSNTLFTDRSRTTWERPYEDYKYISRTRTPRMPWHDLACAFIGLAVSDAVKHFAQRYKALKPQEKFPEFAVFEGTFDDIFADSSTYYDVKLQVLRSVDNWSAGQPHEASIYDAYLRAIESAEHYIYIENQFFISSQPGKSMGIKNEIQSALVDRIYRAYEERKAFHVMIVIPLKPDFGPEDWKSVNSLTVLSNLTYATLYRGKHSLLNRLKQKNMSNDDIKRYFSVYGLRTHSSLNGTLVTEIIYVHSKVLIVDDRLAIIGSANINDRSMLGWRDSEIAVIVEDVEMIDSKMNDEPYQVGKFSHSLRCHLLKEHLGLLSTGNEVPGLNVEDPLADSFYAGISEQAHSNTLLYEEVFQGKILPTDEVQNFEQLEKWIKRQGLVDTDRNLAEEELQKIQGNIVIFPRFFLKDELKPSSLDHAPCKYEHRKLHDRTDL